MNDHLVARSAPQIPWGGVGGAGHRARPRRHRPAHVRRTSAWWTWDPPIGRPVWWFPLRRRPRRRRPGRRRPAQRARPRPRARLAPRRPGAAACDGPMAAGHAPRLRCRVAHHEDRDPRLVQDGLPRPSRAARCRRGPGRGCPSRAGRGGPRAARARMTSAGWPKNRPRCSSPRRRRAARRPAGGCSRPPRPSAGPRRSPPRCWPRRAGPWRVSAGTAVQDGEPRVLLAGELRGRPQRRGAVL